jgi:inorganic phosphate transporter, PiT family
VADVAVSVLETKITRRPGKAGALLFGCVLGAGALYVAWRLAADLSHVRSTYAYEFLLLGLALAVALGFEFVNGFHDTANAVATVIYTHSLEPHFAVVWSGLWNLAGVLMSSGAVAFGIISLLPPELILQSGTETGFAMVFALLVAAIVWNLGTWYFGLPNSSSHTLIGSIIGVGLMNQILEPKHTGTSGVDWSQAIGVIKSLVVSPIVGFVCSAVLLVLLKRILPTPKLYRAPEDGAPPPLWIRGLLVLTCTGVSFAHGSNDGQKGMGLIMLILVGCVPTVYALNHAVGYDEVHAFLTTSQRTERILSSYINPGFPPPGDARRELEHFIGVGKLGSQTLPALQQTIGDVQRQVATYQTLSRIPTTMTGNVRNDMYLAGETFRVIKRNRLLQLRDSEADAFAKYELAIDGATKFIPAWVKVAVALALGLGTMVGWKRIVVTVGEHIGREHLTYAQGACSELVAMGTILAADRVGLPVSTTHVLTSGIGGTMVANGAGLRWSTIRNILMAWLLTLPASIVLSAGLFWLFRRLSES